MGELCVPTVGAKGVESQAADSQADRSHQAEWPSRFTDVQPLRRRCQAEQSPTPVWIRRERTAKQKGFVERDNYRGHVGLDQIAAQSWTSRGCGITDCWNLESMHFLLSHVELVLRSESRAETKGDSVAPGCWEKSAYPLLKSGFASLFCKYWLMR